jgi:hypothetical protein
MLGSHGIAGNREITQYVGRQRIQMPARDIDAALFELAEQGILERLGGSMYRVSMELFRAWVKAHHTLLDTVRQTNATAGVRARRFSPLSSKRIDWFGLLLWVLAGAIALPHRRHVAHARRRIAMAGSARWHTPDAQEAGIPAEVAVRLTPLPR